MTISSTDKRGTIEVGEINQFVKALGLQPEEAELATKILNGADSERSSSSTTPQKGDGYITYQSLNDALTDPQLKVPDTLRQTMLEKLDAWEGVANQSLVNKLQEDDSLKSIKVNRLSKSENDGSMRGSGTITIDGKEYGFTLINQSTQGGRHPTTLELRDPEDPLNKRHLGFGEIPEKFLSTVENVAGEKLKKIQ